MIKEDFHVHSNFSDGKHTPEEIVLKAMEKGMKRLGFSDHGYAIYDLDCCIKKDKVESYKEEIKRLKEKYKDSIEIFLGIEKDFYSEEDTADYEYVIGSVHNLKYGDNYYTVDYKKEILIEMAEKCFNGDIYSLVEQYFETVKKVYEKTKCDLIGHFDLISKLNEKEKLFDIENERYVKAWKSAVDELIKYNIPFEINTGAISRGYKSVPYPDFPIMKYIKEKGGRFVFSSDSHDKDNLCYQFDKWEEEIEKIGCILDNFIIIDKP